MIRGPKTLAIIAGGAALGVGALMFASGLARVAAAYKSKTLCSEVFLAGRDRDQVEKSEFAGISPALELASSSFDLDRQSVKTSLFGLGGATAQFRPGLGCTIVAGGRAC